MSKLPLGHLTVAKVQARRCNHSYMVGCSYDDNGMVQHIVYIVHFTSTSTPHLLVTCLS